MECREKRESWKELKKGKKGTGSNRTALEGTRQNVMKRKKLKCEKKKDKKHQEQV